MTTTATTTTATFDTAIATVIAWFRARARMTVLQLAREAGVTLRMTTTGLDPDGLPSWAHSGPLSHDLFGGCEGVFVAHEGFGPRSPAVRRAFLEGLAAVLLERELRVRGVARGKGPRFVAGYVELPRTPRAVEAAWWREQYALADEQRAENERRERALLARPRSDRAHARAA